MKIARIMCDSSGMKIFRTAMFHSQLLFAFFFAQHCFSQVKTNAITSNPDSVVFRDTFHGWVADSFVNNMGEVRQEPSTYLIKHFKYIGKDTVWITNAFTNDPHYICQWPKEMLIPGKVYAFKVCFTFQGRPGSFNKVMGFHLSNGISITYRVEGRVLMKNEVPSRE